MIPRRPSDTKQLAKYIILIKCASVSFVLFCAMSEFANATNLEALCSEYDRQRSAEPLMRDIVLVQDCAHEKAALLAHGSDAAETIATAIADLCSSEIITAKIHDYQRHPKANPQELENSYRNIVVTQARIEVLRQRAGHCPPP